VIINFNIYLTYLHTVRRLLYLYCSILIIWSSSFLKCISSVRITVQFWLTFYLFCKINRYKSMKSSYTIDSFAKTNIHLDLLIKKENVWWILQSKLIILTLKDELFSSTNLSLHFSSVWSVKVYQISMFYFNNFS
jgi:hypothetical protein